MSAPETSYKGKPRVNQEQIDYKVKTCCGSFQAVLAVALIIIGSLALTGRLNAVVAGGSAIGLASVALIANIAHGKKTRDGDNRIAAVVIHALISIAIIVIASLAIKGILPTATLGKVTVGLSAFLFASAVTAFFVKRITSCYVRTFTNVISNRHGSVAYRVT